jgi:hypothetical protein
VEGRFERGRRRERERGGKCERGRRRAGSAEGKEEKGEGVKAIQKKRAYLLKR